jgi:probable phosphoglycerate mutase
VEIFLVRHGETEWSASGKHTSRTDIPLTEGGRERARALGPLLSRRSYALVLTSPLIRARDTCELAGFGESAAVCDDLREWDYGEYEGRSTPEIRVEHPGWSVWRDPSPGGERPEQVGKRADRVIERMRAADGDVLAFGHGHMMRILTARWLQMPATAGARFKFAAGAISILGFERETEVIESWNLAPRE